MRHIWHDAGQRERWQAVQCYIPTGMSVEDERRSQRWRSVELVDGTDVQLIVNADGEAVQRVLVTTISVSGATCRRRDEHTRPPAHWLP